MLGVEVPFQGFEEGAVLIQEALGARHPCGPGPGRVLGDEPLDVAVEVEAASCRGVLSSREHSWLEPELGLLLGGCHTSKVAGW